jgi:hypothetical protein
MKELQSLLTAEDSKRVADAIIRKIENSDLDIAGAISGSIEKLLFPKRNGWVSDWLPITIEEMCDNISRSISGAAYKIADNKLLKK